MPVLINQYRSVPRGSGFPAAIIYFNESAEIAAGKPLPQTKIVNWRREAAICSIAPPKTGGISRLS
jgi:hypothetical protein